LSIHGRWWTTLRREKKKEKHDEPTSHRKVEKKGLFSAAWEKRASQRKKGGERRKREGTLWVPFFSFGEGKKKGPEWQKPKAGPTEQTPKPIKKKRGGASRIVKTSRKKKTQEEHDCIGPARGPMWGKGRRTVV